MAYTANSPALSFNDKLYMARRKLFALGGRFVPYMPLRRYCFMKAGVSIGTDVYIGEDLIITQILEDRQPHLFIGDRAAIAQRVTIITASDPNYSRLSPYCEHICGKVIIQNDAWIGAGVIILPNVTIGAGSIVAAGAVVTRDVPQSVVVAGIPAKVIKTLPISS